MIYPQKAGLVSRYEFSSGPASTFTTNAFSPLDDDFDVRFSLRGTFTAGTSLYVRPNGDSDTVYGCRRIESSPSPALGTGTIDNTSDGIFLIFGDTVTDALGCSGILRFVRDKALGMWDVFVNIHTRANGATNPNEMIRTGVTSGAFFKDVAITSLEFRQNGALQIASAEVKVVRPY